MANSITGIFLGGGAIRQISDTFKVRAFWVDISDRPDYPNTPEFQLANDKVVLIDNLKKGDVIEVSFSVRGRKWEKDGRSGVNTNLDAYKIMKVQKQSTLPESTAPVLPVGSDEDDKLPF